MPQGTDSKSLSFNSPSPLPAGIARRYGVIVLLIAFALLIVVCRSRTFSEPLDRDITTAILMGRGLTRGLLLYVDMVEFKPPGAYVLWMLVHRLIGTEPPAIAIVNVAVSILTMLGLYVSGSRLAATRRGGVWAAGFWVIIGGEYLTFANQPNIEVFINVFMVWGVAVLLTINLDSTVVWRSLLTGALFFAATMQKHHLVVPVALIGIGWLIPFVQIRATRTKALTIFLIVAATVFAGWALVTLYFALTGRIVAFYNQMVGLAGYYASSHGGVGGIANGGILENIVSGFQFRNVFPACMRFLTPLVIFDVIGLWLLYSKGHAHRWLLAGWILGTQLVVSIPGTYMPHYYQLWMPLACLLSGYAVGALRRHTLYHFNEVIGALAATYLIFYILPQLALSPEQASVLKFGDVFVDVRQVGQKLEKIVPPDETFYAMGYDPGLYYYAHRVPPTGILWINGLLWGPLVKPMNDKVLADLNAKPPAMLIVEERLSSTALNNWLKPRYIYAPQVNLGKRFIALHRRGFVLSEASISSADDNR